MTRAIWSVWPDRDSAEKIQPADAVVMARNMWRIKFDTDHSRRRLNAGPWHRFVNGSQHAL